MLRRIFGQLGAVGRLERGYRVGPESSCCRDLLKVGIFQGDGDLTGEDRVALLIHVAVAWGIELARITAPGLGHQSGSVVNDMESQFLRALEERRVDPFSGILEGDHVQTRRDDLQNRDFPSFPCGCCEALEYAHSHLDSTGWVIQVVKPCVGGFTSQFGLNSIVAQCPHNR